MSHRHSIFCILPPHMLDQVAQNGTSAQREMAVRTLATSQRVRDNRVDIGKAAMRARGFSVGGNVKQRIVYDANF